MITGKAIRVFVLMLILVFVALDTWITRMRAVDWDTPLRLSLYPIVADGKDSTREYVKGLQLEDFSALETFLQREAKNHGVALTTPLRVRLGQEIAELPPQPPADRGLLGTAWWSLKLRWWSKRKESAQPPLAGQVRIFVLYYDPDTSPRLAHSLGLQKGWVGVVHAFASRNLAANNNVVIAHELLHTLGASDKYNPRTTLPLFPGGYADPKRNPLYPQVAAEIMGGRIPVSGTQAEIPANLDETVVGLLTAREIGWSKQDD